MLARGALGKSMAVEVVLVQPVVQQLSLGEALGLRLPGALPLGKEVTTREGGRKGEVLALPQWVGAPQALGHGQALCISQAQAVAQLLALSGRCPWRSGLRLRFQSARRKE